MSWNLITEILKDETETVADTDISQRLISTLQEQPDFKSIDMNTESIRFRHPSLPNVHVEATEMKTPAGQTLIRAMSLSQVQEDADGNVIEARELHRGFSVTGEVWDSEDLAWLNEFDEALTDAENFCEEDISVSRQSYRQDGQLVKGITIAKQFPQALDNEYGNQDISDMLLGNAMTYQLSGPGLLRSLSAGSVGGSSPRPPGWSPRAEIGAMSPAARGASDIRGSGPVTGLQRMNSSNSQSMDQHPGSFAGLMRSLSGGGGYYSSYAPPPSDSMTLLLPPQSAAAISPPTIQLNPQNFTSHSASLTASSAAGFFAPTAAISDERSGPEAKRQRTNSSDTAMVQTVDMWGAIYKPVNE